MESRTVFVRHTGVDGNAHVAQHQLWDTDLFLATRQAEVDKANADARKNDGLPLAKVEVIDRATYQREKS